MRGLWLGLAGLLLMVSAGQAAPLLRSPWDAHPPALVDQAYACPALQTLPAAITANSYYSDPQHSRIDPARRAQNRIDVEAIDRLMTDVEAAGDRFVATGSSNAARCGIGLLAAQAAASAMTGHMSSNQAFYMQGWAFGGLGIAWLKLRTSGLATPEQARAIAAWLVRGAGSIRAYMIQRRANPKITDARNNHVYWAALTAMAAGVSADDTALFDWGVDIFGEAARAIGPDGTLPLEMARGQLALHYHLFAAAPLVVMAEFGAANGRDLYALQGNALARLAHRALAGLQDNRFFAARAGVAQDTPSARGVVSSDLLWARPFVRRFPDPAWDALAPRVRFTPDLYLGGLPPD